MQVTNYSFGHIEIDGKAFEHDVVVTPREVHSNWWRKEGHRLSPEDLGWVVEGRGEVVVIGKGFNSCMDVPSETIEFLEKHKMKVLATDTKRATEEFNRLEKEGKRVVGAFHLTC